MTAAALQFFLSAVVIVVAGTFLTRFADAIADLTKLGKLMVGSIFLAGATSLPELTVDVSAARMGLADVAVGDLLGSSLFNLLILGILDLSHRSRGRLLSRVSAAHALSATMSIALTALVGVWIVMAFDFTIVGVGIGSVTVLIAYVLGFRLVYYDQQMAAKQTGGQAEPVLVPAGRLTLRQAVAGYVVAAAVIFIAGPFLANAAGRLAELTGLGDTFVGTTLVALSTSLPELATTLTALRGGAFDLALGNIFGSNCFNMMLVVPVDMAYPGALLGAAAKTHMITCLATILVTSVAVLGQLYRIEQRLRFVEPDALLVILLVLASLLAVYYIGPQEAAAVPDDSRPTAESVRVPEEREATPWYWKKGNEDAIALSDGRAGRSCRSDVRSAGASVAALPLNSRDASPRARLPRRLSVQAPHRTG